MNSLIFDFICLCFIKKKMKRHPLRHLTRESDGFYAILLAHELGHTLGFSN